jgi:acetylornithine deacetylase/succinyl-diaminopimelate desuccinylase-like protein
LKHLLLLFCAILLAPLSNAQLQVDDATKQFAHDTFKQLIEMNTTDSVGNVTTAAEAMAHRFRDAGFPESDLQILGPNDRKKNLVVRLHGSGKHKPVLLIGHLDVVEARREDWTTDPFQFVEKDGYYYGRGTQDMKDGDAIMVTTLIRMKREGFVPDRDIILALTADEEGGEANGAKWLATEHKDLVDAEYALNEGADGSLVNAKPVTNGVQAAEKVSVNFTLTATNSGGHSSMPRPDNAIYELSHALIKISDYHFPIVLNPITKAYFTQASIAQPNAEIAAAMKAIVANPKDAKADALLSKDPHLASIMRTTCVATRLFGGHAYNALPQTATANVNCRAEPTTTYEYVKSTLERVIGDTGVKVTFMGQPLSGQVGVAPLPLPADLQNAISSVTKKMWGNIPVVPEMSTGATDGRYMRAAGIPTFGLSGIFYEGEERNMHGRDEKVRVKSYYDGLAFLDQVVRTLAVRPKT